MPRKPKDATAPKPPRAPKKEKAAAPLQAATTDARQDEHERNPR